jgi:hypothetical protein
MHHTRLSTPPPHTHTHFQWSRNSRGKKPPGKLRYRRDIIPHLIIYCTLYSCCYATTARRNMRCLVTAGKLSLGNCSVNGFPRHRIRMQRSRYCWTITTETVCRVPEWIVVSCQLGLRELTRVLHGRLWQEDLSTGSWRISTDRNRCQGTAD